MEPFKNIYNPTSLKKISKEIKKAYPAFKSPQFEKAVLKDLEKLELKDRVRLIASSLNTYLPNNYKKAVKIILKSLAEESIDGEWDRKEGPGIAGFMTWPLNQYVETYGLNDYETSFNAMIELTKRFSSEFTVRPYLIEHEKKTYADLKKLIKHPNKHVRRWVSEGTRPHLPWGLSVPAIKDNLSRNIRLLEKLFQDPEEYVRRSVANHLNDISHLDPKLMLRTCKDFLKKDKSRETQWIVRHATRTLLKKGNKEALVLNGFTKNPKVKLTGLKLGPKRIKEGDSFDLSFALASQSKSTQRILIEYIIHYPKKNGTLSPKAFRLKDFKLKPQEKLKIKKSVHFKKVTTRVHYKGKHPVEIQINGEKLSKTQFTLGRVFKVRRV